MSIYRPIVVAASLATAMTLAGCGGSAEVINANAEGITLTLDDDRSALEAATEAAQEHCAKYDRVATLDSTQNVGKNDRIANFKCVEESTQPKEE
jgi:hypothetical protein